MSWSDGTSTQSNDATTTAILTPVGEPARSPGDRLAEAATDVRDRVGRLDAEAKLAWVGALLTTLAFLVLPYAGARGPAVEIGGRVWWRPVLVLAVAAMLTWSRRWTATVVAVLLAGAAVSEAGLFALVSRSSANLRIGFFVMLIGAVLVAVAAVRAATRDADSGRSATLR